MMSEIGTIIVEIIFAEWWRESFTCSVLPNYLHTLYYTQFSNVSRHAWVFPLSLFRRLVAVPFRAHTFEGEQNPTNFGKCLALEVVRRMAMFPHLGNVLVADRA
jgi:hypothetical protein